MQELDEIADELYALRPDRFAAARDEQVRTARAAGAKGQPLARELSRLRRPTLSAWLINLVWRDQRQVMEQLFELADELRRAQAEASGAELRSLNAQRRQLEAALIGRARTLAEAAGVKVTESVLQEAQETLAAALAQPEVADEVRSGRLVKPASYAGFGALPARPAAPARRQAGRAGPSQAAAAGRPSGEPIELRPAERRAATERKHHAGADRERLEREQQAQAERERREQAQRERREQAQRERREQAERRVRDARAAVEAAAQALADSGRAAEAAHQHHQDLRTHVDRLQQQLRTLEQQAAAAEQAARTAARLRDQAQAAHAAALQALEHAEADLKT